jgi:hypothetical protein
MSKFLFIGLGFFIAVLVSYFGGWPIPRYDIYGEIKAWAEIVAPAVAILIAAYLGFRGVRETQTMNATLAREQTNSEIERVIRHRQNASRDLARSFAAELLAASVNLKAAAGMVNKLAQQGKNIDQETMAAIMRPSIDLYRSQLPNIGLLGKLAGEIVNVYDQIQTSIHHDSVLLREFETGGPPFKASELETKLRWSDRADAALTLAICLENYTPPAD